MLRVAAPCCDQPRSRRLRYSDDGWNWGAVSDPGRSSSGTATTSRRRSGGSSPDAGARQSATSMISIEPGDAYLIGTTE
jgi:hypothetical protein